VIHNTIESMEERILTAGSMREEDRQELLKLLASLAKEIAALEQTHPDQAESITGFARLSVHEATREEKDEQLLHLSVRGLVSSIKGFEGTHEDLVRAVNSIAFVLANMGL